MSKVKNVAIKSTIYKYIRSLILTGQLKQGDRIPEAAIAAALNVSKTPVREAIRQLEKDNLVTIEPRKGAYVSDISAEDFDSMMIVREPLEGLATYLATINMSDEELTEVRRAADACEKAIASGNQEELTKADTHFHNVITHGSGNTYLINLCQDLQEKVTRFRYIYFKSSKRAEEIVNEHKLIVDAMEKRDAEEARGYSIEHINNLRKSIDREEDFRPGANS